MDSQARDDNGNGVCGLQEHGQGLLQQHRNCAQLIRKQDRTLNLLQFPLSSLALDRSGGPESTDDLIRSQANKCPNQLKRSCPPCAIDISMRSDLTHRLERTAKAGPSTQRSVTTCVIVTGNMLDSRQTLTRLDYVNHRRPLCCKSLLLPMRLWPGLPFSLRSLPFGCCAGTT